MENYFLLTMFKIYKLLLVIRLAFSNCHIAIAIA